MLDYAFKKDLPHKNHVVTSKAMTLTTLGLTIQENKEIYTPHYTKCI